MPDRGALNPAPDSQFPFKTELPKWWLIPTGVLLWGLLKTPAADGRRRRRRQQGAEGRRHASPAVKRPGREEPLVSPVMSPRRQAKATHSSPGVKA
nr:uncharacterized protein LOC129482823 [Symphalangus syndactylus]